MGADVRYGSVCSGIEAASCAWHVLGWRPSFLSEIDAFPRAVLRHHYADTPLHGDFTTIETGQYEPIDLLVGGTPCQSFSIAGLRGGLADERGNLALEYIRLAQRLRPRWIVWENVPGVLSSNGGRDFGAFLRGLAECGYGFAYRVLDAQYFGLAQRRKRVFVVGYFGDWRRAAAVLFERASLRGHPAPSRKKGEGTTHDLAPCLGASGRGFERTGDTRGQDAVVAMCLNAHPSRRMDAESETLVVAHSLRAEGHDTSEDGTGRGVPLVPVAYRTSPNCGAWETGDRVDALTTGTDPSSHVLVFTCKDYGADASNLAPTLRAMGHAGSHANAGGQVAVTVALRGREGGGTAELGGDVATALRASQGGGDKPHVLTSAVRRLTPRECERLQGFPDDYTRIRWNGWRAMDASETPEGCRAQGMEVRQTKKGKWRVNDVDGPRYKALGNSMAVPVMRWIGRRIAAVEAA